MSLIAFENYVSTYAWVPGDRWKWWEDDPRAMPSEHEMDAPTWRVLPPWTTSETPRLLLRGSGGSMRCRPTTEDTALFRNFAAMESTPDQLVEFANQFGALFGANRVGEPFGEWVLEVSSMRFLIGLWDAVHAGDEGALEQSFPLTRNKRQLPFADTLLNYQAYAPTVVRKWDGPDRLVGEMSAHPTTSTGDVLDVAKGFVIDAVNARLHRLGASVQVATGAPFSIQPRNLLGALWLQFAMSIGQGTDYRQCEACGRWMRLSPDENRADRKYCSNRCRNRAMRRRIRAALDLRAAGKSVRQIAKELGSDMQTVQGWLKQSER